ncbi:transposable element Tc1 transposase [Trichonephila clavipes]|nr:transposable element Tc1 transposase [Trichonephila clavipes]
MMPSRRFRKSHMQRNGVECAFTVGMREAGWSYRALSRHLQRTDTVVQMFWQKWLLRETYRQNEGSGRPRCTNVRQDRRIVRQARTSPTFNDTILRLILLPFMARHPRTSFQQDIARPHIARISLGCLCAVNTLPWPERSPVLSSVEHVWNIVQRQIWTPQNIADMEQQLVDAWRNVSQDNIIGASITFLPRRIQACIATRGCSINY